MKKFFIRKLLAIRYALTIIFGKGWKKPVKEEGAAPSRQMVCNRAMCLKCKDVITSRHRHDFVTCGCGNLSLDGGNDYRRTLYENWTMVSDMSIYLDEPFEIVRVHAARGSRGKDGNQPLTWIPLCWMSNDYLEAVLDYGCVAWFKDLVHKEIAYRKEKGIFIKD
jgi:hypothetical protein